MEATPGLMRLFESSVRLLIVAPRMNQATLVATRMNPMARMRSKNFSSAPGPREVLAYLVMQRRCGLRAGVPGCSEVAL